MDNPNQRCASFSFLFEVEIKFKKKGVPSLLPCRLPRPKQESAWVSVCVFRLGVCLRPDTRNRLQYIKIGEKWRRYLLAWSQVRERVCGKPHHKKKGSEKEAVLFFCVCAKDCGQSRPIKAGKRATKKKRGTRLRGKGGKFD